MKKIIWLLLIILILVIFVVIIPNNSFSIITNWGDETTVCNENVRKLNLEDFIFIEEGMLLEKVYSIVGEPDYKAGSGFIRDVYILGNEELLELHSYDTGTVVSVSLKFKEGCKCFDSFIPFDNEKRVRIERRENTEDALIASNERSLSEFLFLKKTMDVQDIYGKAGTPTLINNNESYYRIEANRVLVLHHLGGKLESVGMQDRNNLYWFDCDENGQILLFEE